MAKHSRNYPCLHSILSGWRGIVQAGKKVVIFLQLRDQQGFIKFNIEGEELKIIGPQGVKTKIQLL